MIFTGKPFGEQPGDIFDGTPAGRGHLYQILQFDTYEGDLRVNVLLTDDGPIAADLVRGKGRGIKAVGTGILIALLTAAIPFDPF
jgi:hypothetical protein